jgi:hypothetical protein
MQDGSQVFNSLLKLWPLLKDMAMNLCKEDLIGFKIAIKSIVLWLEKVAIDVMIHTIEMLKKVIAQGENPTTVGGVILRDIGLETMEPTLAMGTTFQRHQS